MSDLSWLNPTPHAIAVYASRPLSPVAAQHSLPSGRYSLTWAGLPPAGSHQLAAGALTRSPRRRATGNEKPRRQTRIAGAGLNGPNSKPVGRLRQILHGCAKSFDKLLHAGNFVGREVVVFARSASAAAIGKRETIAGATRSLPRNVWRGGFLSDRSNSGPCLKDLPAALWQAECTGPRVAGGHS